MSSLVSNLIVMIVPALAGVFLFLPRLRRAKMWTATITPLASIIGSGFLVLAPLIHGKFS